MSQVRPTIVLDTATLIGGLLARRASPPQIIVRAWIAGLLRVALSPEIEAEYRTVLSRADIADRPLTAAVLHLLDARPEAALLPAPSTIVRSKITCRDPTDQMFLDLAASLPLDAAATIVASDGDLVRIPAPAERPVTTARAFVDGLAFEASL